MTTEEYIELNRNADVRRLALQKPPAGVELHHALQQIEGWQAARRKLPTWAATPGIVFPPRLALEQCSSEATATYKRRLIPHDATSLTDLTGGMGVDFFALAPLFRQATYVERQEHLVAAARHNWQCMSAAAAAATGHTPPPGVGCRFVAAEAEDFLRSMEPTDVIYMDPARRDGAGRKVVCIEDCSPDVAALHTLLTAKCRRCVVKLSPMLDISAALRAQPATKEVHVVSLDGECKEVVLVMHNADAEPQRSPRIVCAMLRSGSDDMQTLAFSPDEEAEARVEYAAAVDAYLYEPDAAILKAGAYRTTALAYGIAKLAPHTHLYTSPQPVARFPGRVWHVVGQASFAKRELRAMLAGVRTAEVGVRGFPASVAVLRRQLHIADGPGPHLIATTLADGSHRLLMVEPLAMA